MSEWIISWQRIAAEMQVCPSTAQKYAKIGVDGMNGVKVRLKISKLGPIYRTKPEWIEDFFSKQIMDSDK